MRFASSAHPAIISRQANFRKTPQKRGLDQELRDAEIAVVPFLVVLAGFSARRAECRVASHTSEVQRRNAPVSAAINGILAVSASLRT
jgi:hypothetical protein